MEIIYITISAVAVILIGGLTFGIIFKIFAPEFIKSIELFFYQNNDICYIVIEIIVDNRDTYFYKERKQEA